MGAHHRRPRDERRRVRAQRLVLFLVGCAVVAALVGAALHGSAATYRAVPAALVGTWKGGAHSNGPWCYAFSADGTYRAWPARVASSSQDPRSSPDAASTGTVFIAGPAITFSNGGAPITATWSLSGGRLVLDGQEYLRA